MRVACVVDLLSEGLDHFGVVLVFIALQNYRCEVLRSSRYFELAFFHNVNELSLGVLAIDELISLVLLLIETVRSCQYLIICPVLEERQILKEGDLEHHVPLLDPSEDLLVVISIKYSEDTPVQTLHRGSSVCVIDKCQFSK